MLNAKVENGMPQQPRGRFEANVSRFTPWGAVGWAWAPTNPAEPVQIEAVLDDCVIAQTVADKERPDIVGKGSPARCGFILRFGETVTGSTPPLIRLRLGDQIETLVDCPWSTIEGQIDEMTVWGATGWAWMPTQPEKALFIEALTNERVIGSTLANRDRPDLRASERGSGNYGFLLKFETPVTRGDQVVFRVATTDGAYAQLPNSTKVSDVVGFVDAVTEERAIGWAWRPESPDVSLAIEAVLDGVIIGRTHADKYLEHLKTSGRGTGRYGFVLEFASPVTGTQAPRIQASYEDKSFVLPTASMFIAPFLDTAPAMRPPAAPPVVEGAVDYLTTQSAMGWAWCPELPDSPVTVEAVQDGRIVGTAVAGNFREDLAQGGKGNGHYGFSLTFQTPLKGSEPPTFQVKGQWGFATLAAPSLPTAVSHGTQPSMPVVAGNVDRLTRWEATGWAWMPSDPTQAIEIRAVLDGKIIGRAIADQLRQDLADHGLGTGRYGYHIVFETPVAGDTVPVLQPYIPLSAPLPGATVLPPASKQELARRPRASIETLLFEQQKFTTAGPDFEEFDPEILDDQTFAADGNQQLWLIALYLPQFHAIEENDKFWGKGFTEWRQLPRGMSRYPGHYQPRIPRDLGFYNLLAAGTIEKQFALAKAAGITAFAYYYYWFNGTRVLEKPLDALLSSDIDLPFMIIWANENWTRTWDGSESSVLLRQDYRETNDEALVADLARHFRDPRYLRISGRPLFVIYNPTNIPDAAEAIGRWRLLLRTQHHLDPLIFMSQTFGARDPEPFGLDGAMEFPPHKLSDNLPGRKTPDAYSTGFTGRVIDYEDFMLASLAEEESGYPLLKTVVPSWDNECRRPNRGLSLEGSSPTKYENWLRALCVRAGRRPIYGQPIVAVNAWNEWAEGAYLEPDVYYGAAYLNATARARRSAFDLLTNHSARPRVSVVLPNFNHEKYIVERIQSVLDQTVPPDEIIFLDDHSKDGSVELARQTLRATNIPYRIMLNEQNSGCVFRQWIKGMALAKHDLVWIAETDDTVHPDFLLHILPQFQREDVCAAYGQIKYISPEGENLSYLDGYYDDLHDFDWDRSMFLPAYRAFSRDFAVKNVIPNASGLVFRKPILTEAETNHLCEYRFAGDWYFYALALRGGSLAYCRPAVSYFRLNNSSASRSAFFTDRHLTEHAMVIADLWHLYDIGRSAIAEHAKALACHLNDHDESDLERALLTTIERDDRPHPLRICIASHSFEVGGGEVMPLELANELRRIGHLVTFLVVERPKAGKANLRHRLRTDIPVVYWNDVQSDFGAFVRDYGFAVINSHNVSLDYRLALRQQEISVPYISSLHGGFETVPSIFTPEVLAYLRRTVTSWLYLSEKNLTLLRENQFPARAFHRSFNATPAFTGEWIVRRAFRNEHNIPEDAFVLVLCSRAIEEKGWDIAVEVVAAVAKNTKRDVRLVLIGEGPAATKLRLETDKIKHYVLLLGQVDTPIRYFRCCDAAIFPSTYSGETFPLFLLEAFSAGLPVLSTDIGEINHIMGKNQNERPGVTVAHDQGRQEIVASMVQELSRIVTDKKLFLRMRETALKTSAQFHISELAAFYVHEIRRHIRVDFQPLASMSRND